MVVHIEARRRPLEVQYRVQPLVLVPQEVYLRDVHRAVEYHHLVAKTGVV